MKMKAFNSILLLAAGFLMAGSMASCSPEKPENEKKNKLHEDPARAVFLSLIHISEPTRH